MYAQIISFENLIVAWKEARKGKTKKRYVVEFEKELFCNLMALHYELEYETYKPRPLKSFIVRDPKTRLIHKSEFRDRIIHHAIVNILSPIFENAFIYDSYANRTGKETISALKRLNHFIRKVSCNNHRSCYYLKADIRHYFQEVNQNILLQILRKKVSDEKTLNLIKIINTNFGTKRERESINLLREVCPSAI